jgi:preprotein translocase subunit SecE
MKSMADQQSKSGGSGAKAVEPTRPRPTVMEFIAQVRQEGLKVTWPTIAETRVTTIAVFIMILISIAFFFVVDWVLSSLVKLVLGLA